MIQVLVGLMLVAAVGLGLWAWGPWRDEAGREGTRDGNRATAAGTAEDPSPGAPVVVEMGGEQQEALGIRTAPVMMGRVSAVLEAPGQVIPDEARYAYITPRAKGVIRSVSAQIGQHVEAGALLARIDSEQVAQARLALVDAFQRLEIARARLKWQETIYDNSLKLIAALKTGPPPEEVQEQFADLPVGRAREQLLKAYAQYYLSKIAADRFEGLQEENAVSVASYQQMEARYQVDLSIFRGLMDRMAYEVTLDYTQTRLDLREARTAVKVARETLRVLGVSVEEIVRKFEAGELTGDEAGPPPGQTLEEAARAAIEPSRDVSELMASDGPPVSTYDLRAPFDGTILERDRIVPGVVVDGTHHLFTMANLDRVWVEAFVHESDFDALTRSRGGLIEFTSPAYPGRVFRGEVLYTGDLVEPRSRKVRLLATAENADHALKPGMFVNVEIHSEDARQLPLVPETALLTDGGTYFVFVRSGPARFERRTVEIGNREDDQVAILRGLRPGDQVVVRGAFALKSRAQAGRPAAGSPRTADVGDGRIRLCSTS